MQICLPNTENSATFGQIVVNMIDFDMPVIFSDYSPQLSHIVSDSWTVECLLMEVFEVNTSDQRDGKHLLAQLQEATQSHQLPRTALAPPTESQQNTPQSSSGD